MSEPTSGTHTPRDPKVLAAALAAPFPQDAVKFKPGVIQGNRALAMPYIDARLVQERLDEVLGTHNWQDEYEPLNDGGAVVCRLKIRFDVEWITKVDVGGQSEQDDSGDRVKAAFSDALKRAAVKFGIGRYLYAIPKSWQDWDPQKRQFKSLPTLPGQKPQKAAQTQQPAAQQKPKRDPPPKEKRAGTEQVERIDELLKILKKDKKWLSDALDKTFNCNEPAQLYREEADRVLKGLEDEAQKMTKAASVAANGRQNRSRQPQRPAAAPNQELGEDSGRF